MIKITNFTRCLTYAEDYGPTDVGDFTVCDSNGECLAGAFRCKDFLQDVLYIQHYGGNHNIYGFEWKYNKDLDKDFYLVYTTNNKGFNVYENAENIKTFLVCYFPDIEVYITEDGYIICKSETCYNSLSLLSYFTTMIRLSVRSTNNPEEYLESLVGKLAHKDIHPSDLNGLTNMYPFIDKMYNLNHVGIPKIDENGKWYSINAIHNNTGIQTLINKLKRTKIR